MENKISLTKIITLAVSILTAGAGAAALSACNGGGSKGVDYTKDIKLTLDYTGHNFFQDGIGQVTLFTHIDGDTSHFKCVVGDTTTTLKSRYYGIDTPESTGAIQPWGQEASDYTHAVLERANTNGTIVVSSPFNYYGAPEADSTGSRYLSLVWVNETKKNAPIDELRLLNLMIVQDGWSWAKNLSDIPEYVDTFQAAQAQAEKLKRGMWQADYPEGWSFETKNISVLDLKNEVVNYLNDPSYENTLSGTNVRFTGVVSGYCNNTLYVQEQCYVDPSDESQGMEWGGINIFTGMTPISSKYTEVGAYIRVVGTAKDSETFGFQVTNTQGHWPVSATQSEDDCELLLTAAQNDGEHSLHTFELTSAQQNAKLANKDFENLYCRTSITNELTCSSVYVNTAGDEVTLSFEGCNFSAYLPFQYSGNPDDAGDIWMTQEKFLGKTFRLNGVLSYHATSSGKITYQIVPCGSQDLICTTDSHGTTSSNPFTVSELAHVAASTQSKINYYVRGTISAVSSAKSDSATFTITDGETSATLNNIAYGNGIKVEDIKVGSTVLAYGQVVSQSGTVLNSGKIIGCYPHGTSVVDPLTVDEAVDMALALENGKTTDVLYYVEGEVTEIVSAYDASTKRMTIKLVKDGKTLIVSPKMGTGVSYESVLVGKTIVLRGKLTNKDGVASTLDNGTQVVSVVA